MSSTIDATVIPSGTWTFDSTHSSVGFTVVYMGVAPFSGAFRSFEASLDETGLRGTAQVSSIDVDTTSWRSTWHRRTSSRRRRTPSSPSTPARSRARTTA